MNKATKNILRTAGVITLLAGIAQVIAYKIKKHGAGFLTCSNCGHKFSKACCKSYTLECRCPSCKQTTEANN